MMSLELMRTPEDRFAGLPDYPFTPHHVDVDGVRLHHLDEGPSGAAPVLLLHGEPSWSYLYRRAVPVLAAAGHRVVAPDLVGFGRSDKPARREDHTYQRHVDWMRGLVEQLELRDITLVCHDWGGLIGLRLVAEHGDRFARVVATNTGLPTGDLPMPDIWHAFRRHTQETSELHVGGLVASGCVTRLPAEVIAAYDAPFPDESYRAGPRQMPMLVPITPDDPSAASNRAAWEQLARFQRPFLCAFGDSDPITRGAAPLLQNAVPGARGQPHTTVAGAGHFLPEDRGTELGRIVVDFISATG
jgi:haloalkane dehalogenase